jgi:hypothetical protein
MVSERWLACLSHAGLPGVALWRAGYVDAGSTMVAPIKTSY